MYTSSSGEKTSSSLIVLISVITLTRLYKYSLAVNSVEYPFWSSLSSIPHNQSRETSRACAKLIARSRDAFFILPILS